MSDLHRALLIAVSAPVAGGLLEPHAATGTQLAAIGVYVCVLCALAPWRN